MILNAHRGRVSTRMGVHGGDDGRYGRFGFVARRRMRYIGAYKYDGLVEHVGRPLRWYQNVVDAAQFDVYFQAQVGERLRCHFNYIL